MYSVYKTNIGAIATIVVISALLLYTIYNFQLMLFFNNTKITKMTSYRNLADDLSPRNTSDRGFDLAYDLVDISGVSYLKEEYFDVALY
jgi:hypothetical protein